MEGGVHLGVGAFLEGGVHLGVGPCGGRGLLRGGALWREGSS